MKHFMDIQNLKETDTVLNGEILSQRNCDAFEVGDRIFIEEKYDGSCASIEYDEENKKLKACSRKNELTYLSTLNGFYNMVENLNQHMLDEYKSYVVFGEWSGARNKIVYSKEHTKIWYVFDIFDKATEKYLSQEDVKKFCEKNGFTFIHVFYDGPFVSWDHVRTFLHSPNYGERQEGVVVKNLSKIDSDDCRQPFVLKIVNEDFKESKLPRMVDPEKEGKKAEAEALIESIVTKARVEKMLFKLRDEGILPTIIGPENMKLVAINLPQRIFEDCMKEEEATIRAAGEYAGKMCSSITMKIAKELILG